MATRNTSTCDSDNFDAQVQNRLDWRLGGKMSDWYRNRTSVRIIFLFLNLFTWLLCPCNTTYLVASAHGERLAHLYRSRHKQLWWGHPVRHETIALCLSVTLGRAESYPSRTQIRASSPQATRPTKPSSFRRIQ